MTIDIPRDVAGLSRADAKFYHFWLFEGFSNTSMNINQLPSQLAVV
jgi:hypothetical protein